MLPVSKLFGVGKVTAARLNQLGVQTCGDLRTWSMSDLLHHFGKFGERLHDLCRGIDERPVNPSSERKSVSVEETYSIDLRDLAACQHEMIELIVRLHARVQRAQAEHNIHKLFVKIRFADFSRTTVECVAATIDEATIRTLLETGFQRRQLPVRLLGVGIRLGERKLDEQLHLFGLGVDQELNDD